MGLGPGMTQERRYVDCRRWTGKTTQHWRRKAQPVKRCIRVTGIWVRWISIEYRLDLAMIYGRTPERRKVFLGPWSDSSLRRMIKAELTRIGRAMDWKAIEDRATLS